MREFDADISAHYEVADERARLSGPAGRVEFARTLEILGRTLPPPPARILDVGGGPGRYAEALAGDGYAVTLVDPVPLHLEQARHVAARSANGFGVQEGDARDLDAVDATVDVLLLLGPLYHLDADGRGRALAEARRALRPGGRLVAAAISRFASLLDGLRHGWLADDAFAEMVKRDLRTGEHHNPDPVGRPEWFTHAWFHRPEELRGEITSAGFDVEDVVAVEGPLWLLEDLDRRWADDDERARLLDAVRAVESEPSMLGVSAHLLVIARRP